MLFTRARWFPCCCRQPRKYRHKNYLSLYIKLITQPNGGRFGQSQDERAANLFPWHHPPARSLAWALPYRALTNKVVIQLQSEGRTPFGTVAPVTMIDSWSVLLPTAFDMRQMSIATSSIAHSLQVFRRLAMTILVQQLYVF